MDKPPTSAMVEHDASHHGCVPCMGAIVRQGLAPWSNQESQASTNPTRGDHS